MDVVFLSRVQFALTIMFHYLFPPLTIGMGIVLVYLDWRWVRSNDLGYEKAAKFWTKLFALNFAVGVATGIVMEFEFGTNWAAYSRFVGDVFGSALAAEGIFAFFLESGFLAVLVFGWDRVSRRLHFFSTCMVALGSIFSSIWIVVANSWQQTPAGSHIVPMIRDGKPWVINGETIMRAEIVDFWAVVFNPSAAHRLTHVLLGCFIMGAAFVLSISAWYVLKNKHLEFARRSFRGALILATVSTIAIAISGHFQGRNVYRHQPAKMAAMEGHYVTGTGASELSIFGWPDDASQRVRGGISIPGGLSFLIHDDWKTPVMGLDKFRPEHRPPVLVTYMSYHLMIASGVFFLVLCLYACWRLRRGTLYESRWLMVLFWLCVIPATLANQAGWVAAEVGRQPWIVHPVIARDADGTPLLDPDGYIAYQTVTTPEGATRIAGLSTTAAVSTAIKAQQVLRSIILFTVIYLVLGALWAFLLYQKVHHGPDPVHGAPEHGEGLIQAGTHRHDRALTGADSREGAD